MAADRVKLYRTRIMDAVCRPCGLRPPVRHLIMVMAHMADGRTGIGYCGQDTLARATGYSDRTIRELLAELSATESPPCQIARRRRRRPDGRGRSSDVYHVQLPDDSTGSTVPLEAAVQPEADVASTGSSRMFNRKPASDDQDRISNVSGSTCARRKRTHRTKPPNGDAHRRVTDHYFQAFETKRGSKPLFDGAEGTAVKRLLDKCKGDVDKACAYITAAYADDWWGERVTIRQIASDPDRYAGKRPGPRRAGPPQQNTGVLNLEDYR